MPDDSETLLLVDDESSIVDGLALALRREPYAIVTAVSPIHALHILATRRVDVVVSDERMPDMSGSEFLRQVHRRWPHILRILLTGEADLEITARAIREDNLYRFLGKPVLPADLGRIVRRALDLRQTMDARARLSLSPARARRAPWQLKPR
jgi:DNA-binding NtrC family response regulator